MAKGLLPEDALSPRSVFIGACDGNHAGVRLWLDLGNCSAPWGFTNSTRAIRAFEELLVRRRIGIDKGSDVSDYTEEDAMDVFEEWNRFGRPGPDNKRPRGPAVDVDDILDFFFRPLLIGLNPGRPDTLPGRGYLRTADEGVRISGPNRHQRPVRAMV